MGRIIAFAMCVMSLFVFSGCGASNKSDVYLTVGNKNFEVNEMYYNIYQVLGYYLGDQIAYDESTDIETIKTTLDSLSSENEEVAKAIDQCKINFVKQKICDEAILTYAKENKIELTSEDKAEADETLDSYKDFFASDDTVTNIQQQKFNDTEEGKKSAKEYLKKYKTAFLGAYGVSNFNELKSVLYDLTLINKALQTIKDGVADDEEQIKKYYNDLVAAQKKSYDADVANFEYDMNYGETVVYYPAGLRYVKHILVQYSEEDKTKLNEYATTISGLEGKENLTDEEKKTLADTQKLSTDLQAKMEKEAKDKADGIYAKLAGGEDFEKLLKEYGEDQGMKEDYEGYNPNGYMISKASNMVPEFLNAALGLKNIGDYVGPVKSSYGYHIIKYTKDVENKVVAYEEIRDTIVTEAMEDKKNKVALEFYNKKYDETVDSVTINYEVLGMDKETYDTLYAEMMAEN